MTWHMRIASLIHSKVTVISDAGALETARGLLPRELNLTPPGFETLDQARRDSATDAPARSVARDLCVREIMRDAMITCDAVERRRVVASSVPPSTIAAVVGQSDLYVQWT